MESSCMDIDRIVDYIGGRLSDRKKNLMEEHLSRCDVCLEEFVTANALLQDPGLARLEPVSEETARSALKGINLSKKLARFHAWIKRTLTPNPPLQPGLATVRGGDHGSSSGDYVLITRESGELSMEMCMEKAGDNRFHARAKLIKQAKKTRNVRLTLIKGSDEAIVSRLLKDEDEIMEGLPFGDYRAILTHNGEEKGEYCFEIDGDGLNEK